MNTVEAVDGHLAAVGETVSDSVATVRIILGGDVLLGRQMPGYVALNGSKWPFCGIAGRLAKADLAMVNLETSVSTLGDFLDKGGRQPYYYHNHPEMLEVLVDAGIQAVCTANNHAMDYGREALAQQCDVLDACGFVHFGAGRNQAEAAAPGYVQVGGLVVAFFGLETETPCVSAEAEVPGIHHASVDDAIQALAPSIAAARTHADIVIVSPHWGGNWQENPAPQFRAVAHSLIDLGADAVLGHSAHILQGVELYRGCPIVYDMGTLLFDRVSQNRMRYSALFELELTANGVNLLEIIPVKLTTAQATLAGAQDAEYIRELLRNLSRALDPDIEFALQGESLLLKCSPLDSPRRKARNGTFPQHKRSAGLLHRVPAQYRLLKSNVVYAEMPAGCAWSQPVRVNHDLAVLGAQFAGKVRTRRGFVCAVFFRAAKPPPGRWEACISAQDAKGNTVFVYKHPVAEGVWPSERWHMEEIIGDHIVVRPVVEVPDGIYRLFWHLLDLENRVDMTVQGEDPRIVDGKVYLGEIEISAKAPAGVAGVAFPLPGRVSPADVKPCAAKSEMPSTTELPVWLANAQSVREGWQCKVYIFQYHVIKVLKTYEESWQTVTKEYAGDTAEAVAIVRNAVLPSIALLAKNRPPAALVAFFEVLGEGVYLQKRGQNIGEVVARHIKRAELQEIRSLLQRTLELVLELWRYGLSETSWKFNKNFGVTDDGEIALLDSLELTGDFDFIRSQLEAKRWRKKNNRFIERLPPPLDEEFRTLAENILTPETLLAVWSTKLPSKPHSPN